MAEHLGAAVCPLCRRQGARASVMKTGRACIKCQACRVQVLARGSESDRLARELLHEVAPEAADPAPALPAPVPPAARPAAESSSWGLWP